MQGGPRKKGLISLKDALKQDDFLAMQMHLTRYPLPVSALRNIFFAAAKYTSLLEAPRRYNIIVEIFLNHRSAVDPLDIRQGYKLAASGGNIPILELFKRRFANCLNADVVREACALAAREGEFETVDFFLEEAEVLPIQYREQVMIVLSSTSKLLSENKRLEMIKRLLALSVSPTTILKVYYSAARAGNFEIFKYLDEHYHELIQSKHINKAFAQAVFSRQFLVANYILENHGKCISPENKGKLLLALAGTEKIIDPELRLRVLALLLTQYREEISIPVMIQSYKAAASAGNVKILEKLDECYSTNLTEPDLNEMFVTKPTLHFDKYLFLLQRHGRKLSPRSKGIALVDIASYTKHLETTIRFESIQILLKDYGSEIEPEDKVAALDAVQKQDDTKVLGLFQSFSRDTFPNSNMLGYLMSSLTTKFSKAGIREVDHEQEALQKGIHSNLSFSERAQNGVDKQGVDSSSSSIATPLSSPDKAIKKTF